MTPNELKMFRGGMALARLLDAKERIEEVAGSELPGEDGARLTAAADALLDRLNELVSEALAYTRPKDSPARPRSAVPKEAQ